MLANGIRFFANAFLSLFAMVAETCRRIFLAWARVDRVACWLAVGMLVLAVFVQSSFCFCVAVGAVVCISAAAWRGERWNLKKDFDIASHRFRQGWSSGGGMTHTVESAPRRGSSRTTFTGSASATPAHETAADALKRRFAERIVGQRQAQELIVSRLESLLVGTRPRTKAPVSFLFVGATGTGKGELASVIGEVMGRNVAKFNMSEYNNDHTLWTLLGSPKGHVNPEEGLLTSAVRNDPKAILFFDEIEKGHPRIYDIFLSILDDNDGTFGDPKTGQKLRCSDTIVIFASNLLGDLRADQHLTQNALRDELRSSGMLRSEFVARIASIVPFYQLTADELWSITEKQIAAYLEDVCDRKGFAAQITVDKEVVRHLVDRQDPKYGARNVRTSIEELLEPAVRDALMRIGNQSPEVLHVRKAGDAKLEVATRAERRSTSGVAG
jgi:ATP-dependent Clp protease ATP-binding subunit ClpA